MLTVSTPNEAMIHPDQSGIQKVLEGFADGWNRHDVKKFSSVFVEDADFTNVMGHSRHGRLAIEELHEPGFNGLWAHSTLTIIKSKTRYLKLDVAAVDAWWRLITVMHNMDLPGSTAQNCYPAETRND